jgi:hypothetical protein
VDGQAAAIFVSEDKHINFSRGQPGGEMQAAPPPIDQDQQGPIPMLGTEILRSTSLEKEETGLPQRGIVRSSTEGAVLSAGI